MSRVRATFAKAMAAAGLGVAALAATILLDTGVGTSPALGQASLTDALTARGNAKGGPSRLLVDAREIVYNDDKNTVSASGDVELNYQNRNLQADRVVYDRGTGRVLATGNVRLTEANGTVTTGDRFELTDDFRTGFIDTLRVEQTVKERGIPVKTRVSAPRAERVDGDITVFDKGIYTACEPCREHPERPPLWQVKAARIIHNNTERTIYYEDATVEFLGIPIAYVPYFWTPDPTVRRQTGFLVPHYTTSHATGTGISVPFFWAIDPSYDLTVQPTFYTRQGVLAQAEFRQRLLTGAYAIRAAGIFQQDKSAFLQAPLGAGNRDGRGSLETVGRFNINERWHYGWDIALLSDKFFLQNYKIRSESLAANYLLLESNSTIFLQGQGDRSYFDARGYYFKGLSYADWQKQLPLVAPVIDYEKRIDGPQPLGGEVKIITNITNLHRDATQYQPISLSNQSFPFATTAYPAQYESCAVFQRNVCLVRGLAGDYARATADVSWRRQFIDDYGQVWTPFASVRADGFFDNPTTTGFQNNQIGNFFDTRNEVIGRVMPAVGVEYRYPFVADAGRYGTHTLTPIGQLIIRPNESHIGSLPNEDAHSLVFDDTTLFNVDKFSGYDRVEGGTRANIGLRYDVVTPSGWTGNALFGQSYQLAGRNSYAVPDLLSTGVQSGLDTRVSDFVGRIQVNPTDNLSFVTRARFDKDTFKANTFEAQGIANLKPVVPVTGSVTYVRYEAQPEQGYSHKREGLQPAASFQLSPNWSVAGSVLFDLDRYLDQRELFATTYAANLAKGGQALANTTPYIRADQFSVAQTGLSLGYKDECTTFSINYAMTPRISSTGTREADKTVLVRLELRTLGQTTFSETLSSSATADGIATR